MRKLFLSIIVILIFITGCGKKNESTASNNLNLLISSENKDLTDLLDRYAKKNKIDLTYEFAGTLEIIDILNKQSSEYDGVWLSNSIWLYMLDNPKIIKNSKSVFIEPIVFGIKKSKAESLGFTDGERILTNDILDAVNSGRLKFIMPSVTQTNSGASAYLGLLSCLAGNPEVLTSEDLKQENLTTDLKNLFKGVERSSGSEEYSNEIFLNGDFEAMVSYESSIINLNQKLEENSEPLYIIYPFDGVSLSDSPFCYVDNGDKIKEENFLNLQSFLLSTEIQNELLKRGIRAGYGGLIPDEYGELFKKEWGIDKTKYISPIKYPSSDVIDEALNLYQETLRKPTAIVFCLDYSGSMVGDGHSSLVEAMSYILNEAMASKDRLQFTEKDKVYIIPFSDKPMDVISNENMTYSEIVEQIREISPWGATNIYDTTYEAIKILSDINPNEYNRSVVLMTDGAANRGSFYELQNSYNETDKSIPVFSITFGDADENQLSDISILTNAEIFDGKYNLLDAFRTVRGYN